VDSCFKCGRDIPKDAIGFSVLTILQSIHVAPRVQVTLKPAPKFCSECTGKLGGRAVEAVQLAERVKADNAAAV
jgi:hypothetical protein